MPTPAGHPPSIASRVRAVVLLAGAVREGQAGQSIGGLLLDLPLTDNRTLLGTWVEHVRELASAWRRESLVLRVLVNRGSGSATPTVETRREGSVQVRIEPDRSEFRGTGGVLRDLSDDYQEDDFLLVINANQVLWTPLSVLADALANQRSDVTILAAADATPCGIQLIRVGALRSVSAKGFVDLKEQALAALARSHSVQVVRRDDFPVQQVRTLEGYLSALRRLHTVKPAVVPSSVEEDWFRTFGIVSPGAKVAESAVVHDSVVLGTARVGAAAVLVRSVVCDGGIVHPGELVIDRVVLKGQNRARVTTR